MATLHVAIFRLGMVFSMSYQTSMTLIAKDRFRSPKIAFKIFENVSQRNILLMSPRPRAYLESPKAVSADDECGRCSHHATTHGAQ
jgi:hypothetical protein